MSISNKTLRILGFKKDPDHNSFFLTKSKYITIVVVRDNGATSDDGIIFTVIGLNKHRELKKMNRVDYIDNITQYPRAKLTEDILHETISAINTTIISN